jgi:hypothetical protein
VKKIFENKFLKGIKSQKVRKSLYFTYAWGRPYPADGNGSLRIGLGHQRIQPFQFWWLSVQGFGFC